jgi:transketolase
MKEGSDVTMIATGHMVWQCMQAVEILEKENISVELINMHTIKPLDTKAILDSVKKTQCVITAEEHNRYGGLGDSVAQLLATTTPAPMNILAVNDHFGQSGKPAELLDHYGLGVQDVVNGTKNLLDRKVLSYEV